jgi:hypothetical protein
MVGALAVTDAPFSGVNHQAIENGAALRSLHATSIAVEYGLRIEGEKKKSIESSKD